MADNFTDFYTGNMTPPLRMPGGGYAPAPLQQPQMTPEQMYEGIYGEPLKLSTRSVKSVPVPVSAQAEARFGAATGMRGAGEATYQPPPLPNQPSGSIRTAKDSSRLPQTTRDADLLTGYAPLPGNDASSAIDRMLTASGGGFAQSGLSRAGSGSLSLPTMPSADPVHQLNVDVADAEGQMYADNMGMPVRSKSGKVYSPRQAFTPKALSDVRETAPRVTASRGLLATLLGALPNSQSQSNGGGLGSLLSGGQITRAPLAGNPMLVDPSTSSGSTLESMGFSSGTVVPSAVVENLSKRGYI